jgi:hypothetical protein
MGPVLFFSWWYGPGWVNAFKSIFNRVSAMSQFFSLGILAGTLFEPWKQITLTTAPGTALEVKFRAFLDNVFARLFGFVIRSFMIIFGFFAIAGTFVYGVLLAATWPLIPFLPLIFSVMAVIAL